MSDVSNKRQIPHKNEIIKYLQESETRKASGKSSKPLVSRAMTAAC